MTTPLPLPGMPTPPPSEYETWAAKVRPVYAAVAATGRPFLCWKVARDHKLPEPPDQKQDWARLITSLRHDGLIYHDDFGLARDGSAVKQWRGTSAAMQGRAA